MSDPNNKFLVTIVFKEPHTQAKYYMTKAELDRLVNEFQHSAGVSTARFGVYDAADGSSMSGGPVRLALRFADVLYIG
jgi:hypothetical protein